MAVNGQNIFNNDYSFLNLPEVGSDVRSPINTFNLPPNIVAAINKVAPIKLPEMDTPLNFDPFDPNVNNEGLIGAENFSEFLKQMKEKIKFDIEKAIVNKDPIALIDAEEKMEEIVKAEEGEPVADPVADPIIDPVAPYIPQPTPIAQPTPISQPIQPQPAPSFIDNELESLSNPTAAMYSRDVGTGGSMGLGSPMAISSSMPVSTGGGGGGIGSLSGFSAGVKNVLGKVASGTVAGAKLGVFGPLAQIVANFIPSKAATEEVSTFDSSSESVAGGGGQAGRDAAASLPSTPAARIAAAIANLSTPEDKAIGATQAAATLNTRLASGDADTKTLLANAVRNAKADARSAANAADTAGMQRDKASAMNVLYGGAGSSFESGRNEYTESGQYDIDREARQAAFDASNERDRIARGEPYKKLTAEETQQAVRDLQSRIAGPVMISAKGRDNTPLNMDNLSMTDPMRYNAIMSAMGQSSRVPTNNPSPYMGIPGQGGIRSITRG